MALTDLYRDCSVLVDGSGEYSNLFFCLSPKASCRMFLVSDLEASIIWALAESFIYSRLAYATDLAET